LGLGSCGRFRNSKAAIMGEGKPIEQPVARRHTATPARELAGRPERQLTALKGVYRLQLPSHRDASGVFSPVWARADLRKLGLDTDLAQVNMANNPRAGTLRGLHYQLPPFSEVKIVQVITGAIFDVVVDLRPSSPTFRRAMGLRLDAHSRSALYLPKGMAHGYQTLVPDTTVLYTVSAAFSPAHLRGVHWSDKSLEIAWPLTPTFVSPRDQELPFLQDVTEFPEERRDASSALLALDGERS